MLDSTSEQQVAKRSELERRILEKVTHRKPVARDIVAEFEQRLTLGERTADRIASFGGSWIFIGIFVAVMVGWIFLNIARPIGFDPYPFILLNLVLSSLAAMQEPIIMMRQNRMSQKDRLDARYKVDSRSLSSRLLKYPLEPSPPCISPRASHRSS